MDNHFEIKDNWIIILSWIWQVEFNISNSEVIISIDIQFN